MKTHELIPHEAPQLPALTAEEAFQQALAGLDAFFAQIGLRPSTDRDAGRAIAFELSKDCGFDISIRDPHTVAYVTSHKGYTYRKETAFVTPDIRTPNGTIKGQSVNKITATVRFLGEEIKGDHVFQIVLTTKEGSKLPVYVELPHRTEDPVRFLMLSVLGALRMLALSDKAFRETFEKHFLMPGHRMLEDSPGSEPTRTKVLES